MATALKSATSALQAQMNAGGYPEAAIRAPY
jgi:hypothetical protein